MKKVVYISIIVLFLFFSFSLIYVFNKNTDKCSKRKIVTDYKEGNVTLYCTNLYYENEFLEFLETKEANEIIEYKDKTKIYRTDNYSYLLCNNKNIVIGAKSLEYTEGLCK